MAPFDGSNNTVTRSLQTGTRRKNDQKTDAQGIPAPLAAAAKIVGAPVDLFLARPLSAILASTTSLTQGTTERFKDQVQRILSRLTSSQKRFVFNYILHSYNLRKNAALIPSLALEAVEALFKSATGFLPERFDPLAGETPVPIKQHTIGQGGGIGYRHRALPTGYIAASLLTLTLTVGSAISAYAYEPEENRSTSNVVIIPTSSKSNDSEGSQSITGDGDGNGGDGDGDDNIKHADFLALENATRLLPDIEDLLIRIAEGRRHAVMYRNNQKADKLKAVHDLEGDLREKIDELNNTYNQRPLVDIAFQTKRVLDDLSGKVQHDDGMILGDTVQDTVSLEEYLTGDDRMALDLEIIEAALNFDPRSIVTLEIASNRDDAHGLTLLQQYYLDRRNENDVAFTEHVADIATSHFNFTTSDDGTSVAERLAPKLDELDWDDPIKQAFWDHIYSICYNSARVDLIIAYEELRMKNGLAPQFPLDAPRAERAGYDTEFARTGTEFNVLAAEWLAKQTSPQPEAEIEALPSLDTGETLAESGAEAGMDNRAADAPNASTRHITKERPKPSDIDGQYTFVLNITAADIRTYTPEALATTRRDLLVQTREIEARISQNEKDTEGFKNSPKGKNAGGSLASLRSERESLILDLLATQERIEARFAYTKDDILLNISAEDADYIAKLHRFGPTPDSESVRQEIDNYLADNPTTITTATADTPEATAEALGLLNALAKKFSLSSLPISGEYIKETVIFLENIETKKGLEVKYKRLENLIKGLRNDQGDLFSDSEDAERREKAEKLSADADDVWGTITDIERHESILAIILAEAFNDQFPSLRQVALAAETTRSESTASSTTDNDTKSPTLPPEPGAENPEHELPNLDTAPKPTLLTSASTPPVAELPETSPPAEQHEPENAAAEDAAESTGEDTNRPAQHDFFPADPAPVADTAPTAEEADITATAPQASVPAATPAPANRVGQHDAAIAQQNTEMRYIVNSYMAELNQNDPEVPIMKALALNLLGLDGDDNPKVYTPKYTGAQSDGFIDSTSSHLDDLFTQNNIDERGLSNNEYTELWDAVHQLEEAERHKNAIDQFYSIHWQSICQRISDGNHLTIPIELGGDIFTPENFAVKSGGALDKIVIDATEAATQTTLVLNAKIDAAKPAASVARALEPEAGATVATITMEGDRTAAFKDAATGDIRGERSAMDDAALKDIADDDLQYLAMRQALHTLNQGPALRAEELASFNRLLDEKMEKAAGAVLRNAEKLYGQDSEEFKSYRARRYNQEELEALKNAYKQLKQKSTDIIRDVLPSTAKISAKELEAAAQDRGNQTQRNINDTRTSLAHDLRQLTAIREQRVADEEARKAEEAAERAAEQATLEAMRGKITPQLLTELISYYPHDFHLEEMAMQEALQSYFVGFNLPDISEEEWAAAAYNDASAQVEVDLGELAALASGEDIDDLTTMAAAVVRTQSLADAHEWLVLDYDGRTNAAWIAAERLEIEAPSEHDLTGNPHRARESLKEAQELYSSKLQQVTNRLTAESAAQEALAQTPYSFISSVSAKHFPGDRYNQAFLSSYIIDMIGLTRWDISDLIAEKSAENFAAFLSEDEAKTLTEEQLAALSLQTTDITSSMATETGATAFLAVFDSLRPVFTAKGYTEEEIVFFHQQATDMAQESHDAYTALQAERSESLKSFQERQQQLANENKRLEAERTQQQTRATALQTVTALVQAQARDNPNLQTTTTYFLMNALGSKAQWNKNALANDLMAIRDQFAERSQQELEDSLGFNLSPAQKAELKDESTRLATATIGYQTYQTCTQLPADSLQGIFAAHGRSYDESLTHWQAEADKARREISVIENRRAEIVQEFRDAQYKGMTSDILDRVTSSDYSGDELGRLALKQIVVKAFNAAPDKLKVEDQPDQLQQRLTDLAKSKAEAELADLSRELSDKKLPGVSERHKAEFVALRAAALEAEAHIETVTVLTQYNDRYLHTLQTQANTEITDRGSLDDIQRQARGDLQAAEQDLNKLKTILYSPPITKTVRTAVLSGISDRALRAQANYILTSVIAPGQIERGWEGSGSQRAVKDHIARATDTGLPEILAEFSTNAEEASAVRAAMAATEAASLQSRAAAEVKSKAGVISATLRNNVRFTEGKTPTEIEQIIRNVERVLTQKAEVAVENAARADERYMDLLNNLKSANNIEPTAPTLTPGTPPMTMAEAMGGRPDSAESAATPAPTPSASTDPAHEENMGSKEITLLAEYHANQAQELATLIADLKEAAANDIKLRSIPQYKGNLSAAQLEELIDLTEDEIAGITAELETSQRRLAKKADDELEKQNNETLNWRKHELYKTQLHIIAQMGEIDPRIAQQGAERALAQLNNDIDLLGLTSDVKVYLAQSASNAGNHNNDKPVAANDAGAETAGSSELAAAIAQVTAATTATASQNQGVAIAAANTSGHPRATAKPAPQNTTSSAAVLTGSALGMPRLHIGEPGQGSRFTINSAANTVPEPQPVTPEEPVAAPAPQAPAPRQPEQPAPAPVATPAPAPAAPTMATASKEEEAPQKAVETPAPAPQERPSLGRSLYDGVLVGISSDRAVQLSAMRDLFISISPREEAKWPTSKYAGELNTLNQARTDAEYAEKAARTPLLATNVYRSALLASTAADIRLSGADSLVAHASDIEEALRQSGRFSEKQIQKISLHNRVLAGQLRKDFYAADTLRGTMEQEAHEQQAAATQKAAEQQQWLEDQAWLAQAETEQAAHQQKLAKLNAYIDSIDEIVNWKEVNKLLAEVETDLNNAKSPSPSEQELKDLLRETKGRISAIQDLQAKIAEYSEMAKECAEEQDALAKDMTHANTQDIKGLRYLYYSVSKDRTMYEDSVTYWQKDLANMEDIRDLEEAQALLTDTLGTLQDRREERAIVLKAESRRLLDAANAAQERRFNAEMETLKTEQRIAKLEKRMDEVAARIPDTQLPDKAEEKADKTPESAKVARAEAPTTLPSKVGNTTSAPAPEAEGKKTTYILDPTTGELHQKDGSKSPAEGAADLWKLLVSLVTVAAALKKGASRIPFPRRFNSDGRGAYKKEHPEEYRHLSHLYLMSWFFGSSSLYWQNFTSEELTLHNREENFAEENPEKVIAYNKAREAGYLKKLLSCIQGR